MAENPIRCNYPLHWPESWPRRHPNRRRAAFDRSRTLAQSRDILLAELRRLGGHSVEISSNVLMRLDGLPRSGQGQPDDRGVAVYFKLRGKDYAFACDRWDRVEDNIYAIAKHIETMRAQDRYGVGTQEHAFRGYQLALEAPRKKPWWVVLGVRPAASPDEIRAAFKARAIEIHPDVGGSAAEMADLNQARDEALGEHEKKRSEG